MHNREGGESYMKEFEVQIALRVSKELHEKIKEAAGQSHWNVSKQIRAHLERDYGVEHKPFLPLSPSHERPSRKRR
jgi:predicted HicB family RNase H-like nuclease